MSRTVSTTSHTELYKVGARCAPRGKDREHCKRLFLMATNTMNKNILHTVYRGYSLYRGSLMLPSSAGNVTKLDESPGPGEARSGLSLWVRSPFVDLSKSGRAFRRVSEARIQELVWRSVSLAWLRLSFTNGTLVALDYLKCSTTQQLKDTLQYTVCERTVTTRDARQVPSATLLRCWTHIPTPPDFPGPSFPGPYAHNP